ncbi:hypothetical protein EIP91_011226 [Steccherinum ochraceum]|uniref:Zinc finger C2H2 LYAR-type domain-containing protein n=1 Tax=Steccherinum ochraceum TaxID=92696 RepID=A0A4R0RI65_9APHY|nr:hypothetical protein EIP91_011226 [Steccherinum ochraceum]
MVSFQCDACSDVVKKPKLDKHAQMCHSSFTCLDCTTTFNGPAQWKGHITCISEAEKYQKGLYKGAKTNGATDNAPKKTHPQPRLEAAQDNTSNAYSNVNTGKYNSPNPRYTNFSRGGARPAWGMGQPRWAGTGANDTPLGSPARMSPVSFVQVEESAPVNGVAKAVGLVKLADGKKEKPKNETAQNEPPKKKSKLADNDTEPEKKGKKKAEKEVVVPADAEASTSGEKKEKKKKSGKGKEVAGETEDASSAPTASKKSKKEKEKGEKKAKKSDEASGVESTAPSAEEKKKSKKRKHAEADATAAPSVDDAEVATTRKSKKSKAVVDANDAEVDDATEKVAKKQKKHKKSKSKDTTTTSL